MSKSHHLDNLVRAHLERACNEHTKRNEGNAKASQFFVGLTADEHGSGHALVEVKPDGTMVNHWGDADAHNARLKNKGGGQVAADAVVKSEDLPRAPRKRAPRKSATAKKGGK